MNRRTDGRIVEHRTGRPIVTPEGQVIQSGVRIAQVVQLKNRRWIYVDTDGTRYTDRSWHTRDELLDERFGVGGWE